MTNCDNVRNSKPSFVYLITKRFLDIVISTSVLILLAPFFLLIALWIQSDSKGPVFFKGTRIGQNGRAFRMIKFRTMVANADKIGGSSTPEDDPRLTKSGKFLRNYKLDELPQLINVLTGEMSFVGPRPQVAWAVELYNNRERRILDAVPGITDYASIKFRNEAEILRGSKDPDRDYLEKIAPEKIRLGLEYVRKRSLKGDALILLATLWALIGKDPETVLRCPRSESLVSLNHTDASNR